MTKSLITRSAGETQDLAAGIAKTLKGGEVLGLIGGLGVGKTCFVQGLARGLNVSERYYVCSPTFMIQKIYPGDLSLCHFDFYRLNNRAEFEDLGFDDYRRKDGIIVIEWADRFLDQLPEDMIVIRFEVVGENERRIALPEGLNRLKNLA